PSDLKIAGDGFAYLSYRSLAFEDTEHKAAALPYPAAAYDTFDQLQQLTWQNPLDFDAALAELETLRGQVGNLESLEPLRSALQTHNTAMVSTEMGFLTRQFRRLCDDESTQVFTHHVLRVGADGSATDVTLKTWREHETRVHTQTATWPTWHETITERGP